jgi:Ca2+-binding EF-hand superfamily protein
MKYVLVASLALSGVLMAQMGNIVPSYSDFDSDGNGKITQEEFENTQQKRMSEKAESGKMMKNAQNAPAFKDIDTNNDGNIDATEFAQHQMANRGQKGKGNGMGGVK